MYKTNSLETYIGRSLIKIGGGVLWNIIKSFAQSVAVKIIA